jgi:hypothetical protein
VHAQFFHQFALAGDAVQITHQQDAQQQLGIDRGPSVFAVSCLSTAPAQTQS